MEAKFSFKIRGASQFRVIYQNSQTPMQRGCGRGCEDGSQLDVRVVQTVVR